MMKSKKGLHKLCNLIILFILKLHYNFIKYEKNNKKNKQKFQKLIPQRTIEQIALL